MADNQRNIQWFPGHMAKTRRLIAENLKNVDAVIELLDARIPESSRNPEIQKLCEGKPTLILAKSIKGKGVSFMENQAGWHGMAPNQEQYEAAVAELDDELAKLEQM